MPSADESGGNLVEYPGAQAAQTGQLHLALGLTQPAPGLHCLLPCHDGKAYQVDLYGAYLIMERFLPQWTSLLKLLTQGYCNFFANLSTV